jgi:hypothetical protein
MLPAQNARCPAEGRNPDLSVLSFSVWGNRLSLGAWFAAGGRATAVMHPSPPSFS